MVNRSTDVIRVLHVDDTPSQLVLMQEFLKIYDPDILLESVSEPEKALQHLTMSRYDCIVCDYQMPVFNGIELASKIREQSQIPIILYTGKGSEEVAEQAFSVGVNDYFRKEASPQHYQVLANKIRAIVGQRRVEDIYTKVVQGSTDALIIVRGMRVVYGNRSFASLVGVELDEVVGLNILDLVPSRERGRVRAEMMRLTRGEVEYSHLELEISCHGRVAQAEVTASVIDYLGERALLCNIRDVTDRKALEDKLKRSELRYRSLLELAPDGIITINLRGDITWMNPAYTEITGFTSEEIVGKKVWSIGAVRGPDIRVFSKAFFDLIRGRSIAPMVFQWTNKEGEICWGEGRASLLKIDGKKSEVLLILRDITERKKLEDDLNTYARDLEVLAEERAQKLVGVEKIAAVGAVASSMAHDLRGPLAAIRNAVYVMETDPGKGEEMRRLILRAVENAVLMLEDVRGKTSLEALSREQVELAGFIRSVLGEMPVPDGVDVRTELSSVVVDIDRLRIRRVIENLVRNAVEAMDGEGVLSVTARVQGGMAVVVVKDTGVGMSQEQMVKLYTPFNTSKARGTGLGLYYCKKTVEAHGGSISVDSRVGVGSEFMIKLPIGEAVDVGTGASVIFDVVDKVASGSIS